MCKPAPYFAKVRKIYPDAQLPLYGSQMAAGADLRAYIPGDEKVVYINPGYYALIGTGLSITPPAGHFGAILARSGLATKQGLRPANCMGVCDFDYTGEYKIALYNDSKQMQEIHHGDRIAQLVFLPYIHVNFHEVEDLDTTDRGAGGFGSTGKN